MTTPADIQSIDAATLTSVVRLALGRPAAQVGHWEHQPISYLNSEAASLGLHRFAGTAQDGGDALPWSVVLKAVHAPVDDTMAGHYNYYRREVLAYQSGLLDDLPGGLRAPRCLGISEHPGAVCWLWLEDLLDPASPPWSVADYGLAAYHFGRFNGAYAAGQPLPDRPWLSRGFLRGWLGYTVNDFGYIFERLSDERTWQHPLLRAAFPRPVADAVLRLWAVRNVLLEALDQLPRTFCHFDAYQPNLFRRRDSAGRPQTVAIDWVFAGIGGVGEEMANLVAASLVFLQQEASLARSIDDAVSAGYMGGLREAGWQGDAQLVRFGYAAHCALRWAPLGFFWLKSLADAEQTAALEKEWGHDLPYLVEQWSQTSYYVLEVAQEAYRLYLSLFGDSQHRALIAEAFERGS